MRHHVSEVESVNQWFRFASSSLVIRTSITAAWCFDFLLRVFCIVWPSIHVALPHSYSLDNVLCNFHCYIAYIPSLLQLSALYFSVLSVIFVHIHHLRITHTPPFWAFFVHYCFFAHSFIPSVLLRSSCTFCQASAHSSFLSKICASVKFVHPFNTPLHHV